MIFERKIRWYQRNFHEYLVNTPNARAIEIAHRRWGKDEITLNATCELAHKRVASYWHCLPEYEQGRKALWTAINPHTGKRRIDEAFPPEIREGKDEQQMFIKLKCGSTWQIVGSDKYNSLVGAGIGGVVFSEWALANPSAWGYIRPMVEENNGWAAFITTPRGNNHAKSMYEMAKNNPKWFAEISTVLDTGVLTTEQLDEALSEYQAIYGVDLGQSQFEQEYLCSFSGAMVGAYWGAECSKVERENRIQCFDIDYSQPVHTAWDLGKSTNNPIWCFQVIGSQLKIVDFYQPESDDLADWCAWLNDKGYKGNDYVPHDILHNNWGSKLTRIETLIGHGRKPIRLERVSVADGLQAGRESINRALFRDIPSINHGLEGLKNYRREWDTDKKAFREVPVKDWSEHIGSAWRYLALAWREIKPVNIPQKPKMPIGGVALLGAPIQETKTRIRI